FLEMTEGRKPRESGYEEAALICGTRSGKSMIAAVIATYESMKWQPVGEALLMPGQGATGVLIAEDRKAAGILRGYIEGFLYSLEENGHDVLAEKRGQEKAVTGALIKMRGSIEIAIYSANAYSVRGATGLWFIGDESAWWKTEEGAYNQ